MFTRNDYMEKRCTFEEYYGEIASELHIAFSQEFMQQVKNSTDEHLKDIPLAIWDSLVEYYEIAIRHALKKHGDTYSIAGGVCILKTIARNQAKQ